MWNKVQNAIFGFLPYDKCLHFIIGFFLFLLSGLFFSDVISLVIVFVVAVLKEARDQIAYKGWDWKDVIATLIPGLVLFLLHLLK